MRDSGYIHESWSQAVWRTLKLVVGYPLMLLLPLILILAGLFFWDIWRNRSAYDECMAISAPTTLDVLVVRFGKSTRVHSEHGVDSHHFEPTSTYDHAFSADVTARTVHGSRRVIDLYCGEGYVDRD